MEVYSAVGLRDLFSNPNKAWIVLATQSPHRPMIMKNHMGVTNLLTMASGFEEDLNKDDYPTRGDYSVATAENKARIVAKTIFTANDQESKKKVRELLSNPFGEMHKDFDVDKIQVVIGADTIADMNGTIYEKPVDREDARRQLSSYVESYHYIYTGVAMFARGRGYEVPEKKFYTTTRVKYQRLSKEDIEALLDTREHEGSAGSYRITGLGESLIEEVVGSYTNVIGLPAQCVSSALCDLAKSYKMFNF
ncbi:Maf-like family protein [Theileria parva strain Muguga]|uniref:Septum formation protein MAF, putative n=1 Tax=Theileria parva TaxID=5875 RepID=Q4N1M7_THEPA|nr:Maf-like family protein [Theileria parva strain Muguga]EAN32058.1 Maf-like family protein [Theileria parva strain Muguga]|eukprot:XP_764341.1 septum formation protein MAF [Theileria parva strain Muguga]